MNILPSNSGYKLSFSWKVFLYFVGSLSLPTHFQMERSGLGDVQVFCSHTASYILAAHEFAERILNDHILSATLRKNTINIPFLQGLLLPFIWFQCVG